MKKKCGRKPSGLKMCKILLNLPVLYKEKAAKKALRLNTSITDVMRQAIVAALKYEEINEPVAEDVAVDAMIAQPMSYEEFMQVTYGK